MRKLLLLYTFTAVLSFTIVSCGNLTNTTGNLFSLNGTWTMTSTTDGNAMVGTIITVFPVVGNSSIKSISNNTYCVRESDQLWKSIKSNESSGFKLSTLVSACDGATIYRDGMITVVNNDEITVTSQTKDNTELVQRWQRVK